MKNLVINKMIFGLLEKVIRKVSKIYFEYKYSQYIYRNGSVWFGKGIKFRGFESEKNCLEVHFDGRNSIGDMTVFQGTASIHFGLNSFCGEMCVFGSNSGIVIGKDVMIAACVSIRDTDHNFTSLELPMSQQGITSERVVIKDDVWIGHGAVILKGVTVSEGSIVAANAVVTKNVEPYSIVGGVPAKLIRKRI